ncbi:MAG: ABC transporter ATP-binding protein/permease [Heliobacteriaceae bacterium]|jgi:subfamily B ATP-binding cassette protein MsbA|nr:ABC transporter ATP-binding protein/permease [Heliobacteriaceae bacterium]
MKLSKTTAQNSFEYRWLLSRIFPYIKPYMARIIIGFLIAVPVGMLDGVVALSLKPYMDYVIGQKDLVFALFGRDFSITWQTIAFAIPFGVVAFATIQGVLRYLNSYISKWVSQKITNCVKIDLFKRLVYMDASFFDENRSGIILSRYSSDAKTASDGIVDRCEGIIVSGFGALSLIAVMLYSSWKLAAVGVFVLCVAFIPVHLMRKRIRNASNKNMKIGSSINTNFNETYHGNRVMRAYRLQEHRVSRLSAKIKESFDVDMSLTKRSGWMSPLMYLIASIGIAIVLSYGTQLITSGQMTAGSFASFVTSLLLLYKPVKTLGNTMTGLQGTFVAMGRVFELFDLYPEIQDGENAIAMKGLSSGIEFKDVSFEYVAERPVLKNINLKIRKGETLAIVGNSGGGKSTLISLLSRFYDVTSGAITIDGVDLRDLITDSLRKNIALVFQDNFLFSGTIRENILMGNYDASENELERAVKSAHLEEMLAELPDGLDTLIGERGTTLSGGQRQRVAIARAMIASAPIIILDEATSALDNKSEAIVQKALDNLMQDKTVFVIAHRLSTIKNADRIAVINEGELTELGTHSELMDIKDGKYRHLYKMQFKTQEEAL